MKLEKLGTLRELLKHRVLVHVNGIYIWLACTACVVMVALLLYNRLLQTGDIAARLAYDRGQRVIYHIGAGDIDGTPRHTKRETAEVAPVSDPTATPPTQTSAPTDGTKPSVPKSDEVFAGREGLAAAPFDPITEQSDKGVLPIAGHDGTLPWKYYARPYTAPKEARPLVAVVFTNLGLSKPLTEEVLKLPHAVTLSFSPYASDAKTWARKARGEGFESLIDLPLEPADFPISDPGPYGLLNSLNSNDMSTRLHWTLSRYPGFVGALGPASEKLTPNLAAMRSLLTELTARGVLFIYLKTPQNTELANLIKTQNFIAVGADAVIDDDLTPSAIATHLDALAALAKKQGYAIGIAHSYPPSTRALSQWMEELDKKGVDIAPVSAVAKKAMP